MMVNGALISRRAILAAGLGGTAVAVLDGVSGRARADRVRASAAAMAFDGDAILVADGSLSRSEDAGSAWTTLPLPGEVMSLATHPERPGRIIAGLASHGVAVSLNGGRDWRPAGAGLPGAAVRAVTVSARDPDVIYAAIGGDGLWKSEDAGDSWTFVMDRPWLNGAETDPLSLASVQLETGMGGIWIYAGTSAGLTRVPDCFCRWQEVRPGNAMDALVSGDAPPPEAPLPADEPIVALVSAPSSPQTLYAALPSGIWGSDDAGVVWSRRIAGQAAAVAVHPGDERHVAAMLDGRVRTSRDGGHTWAAHTTIERTRS